MKLLRCYIENFGKLHQFNYEFNEGINVLCHENGWGKTTLATFIKVMFYGLSPYKGTDLTQNERKKYTPWQGGNFGGYLEFMTADKVYRVTRFFGKNSGADTYELTEIATGKPSKAFGTNLGEQLFNIDAAGFERTLLLLQKKFDGPIGESITNRLTNLLYGTDQNFNLETALKILDEQRRHLTNRQKTGEIDCLQNQIDQNATQLHQLRTQKNLQDTYQKQLAHVNKQIENLSQVDTKPKLKRTFVWLLSAAILGLLVAVGSTVLLETLMIFYVLDVGLWLAVFIERLVNYRRRHYQPANQDEPTLQQQIDLKVQTMVALNDAQKNITVAENLQKHQDELLIKLTDLQERLQIIQQTQEFLMTASQNLNTQYLAPVQQKLLSYLQLLTNQHFPNLILNTHLQMAFTEYGQIKDVAFYSSGYQNLFEICLRLALIDTLFPTRNLPFIILDDPFVNFDASKITNARNFLRSLAPKWQIIYFTCHPSRN